MSRAKRERGTGSGERKKAARRQPAAGQRAAATQKVWVRARFDAAQTTKDNAKHWSAAEFLSADAEADPNVRKILRTRARYEVQNNSYARGIVKTLAEDTIGTGPRLQMLLEDEETNRKIEHDFQVWAKKTHLASKLRTIRMARCQDGEAFVLLARNPMLKTNVTLDMQLIEADRVTDDELTVDPNCIDGVAFDQFGNPKSYKVLKKHPGGTDSFDAEFVTIKAENMIHVFRQDRPEQHRGIPEITAALPLFAHLRRFTLAVVSAAEAAADFSGILYTDAPANGEADSVEAMDTIQLERNMLLTMPGGWKMSQVDPKQPVTTYGEFKREILNEIARCLSMPFNIAAGNSSVHGSRGAGSNPRTLAQGVEPRHRQRHRALRLPTRVVLGRTGTRRSLQGGYSPAEAARIAHDEPRNRVRQAGTRLGDRASADCQGTRAYEGTRNTRGKISTGERRRWKRRVNT